MYLLTAPLRSAGRVALAGIFVQGGVKQAVSPGPRVEKAAKLGVPAPAVAVRASGAAMVLFGSSLALGIRPRLSATLLAGLLVPVTLAAHDFWALEDPDQRALQQIQFLKNLAAFGGLLEVIGQPTRPHKVKDTAAAAKVGYKAGRARTKAETSAARSRARAEEAASQLWEKAAAAIS